LSRTRLSAACPPASGQGGRAGRLDSRPIDFYRNPALHEVMATQATRSVSLHPELKFWACFAVVMALLTQVFFPPQVMAAETGHGTATVLCSSDVDGAAIVDPVLAKVVKLHKSGLQGLKCANCVLASVTAIQSPTPVFVHVTYAAARMDFRPAAAAAPVGARAPPRPHSCGPPSIA